MPNGETNMGSESGENSVGRPPLTSRWNLAARVQDILSRLMGLGAAQERSRAEIIQRIDALVAQNDARFAKLEVELQSVAGLIDTDHADQVTTSLAMLAKGQDTLSELAARIDRDLVAGFANATAGFATVQSDVNALQDGQVGHGAALAQSREVLDTLRQDLADGSANVAGGLSSVQSAINAVQDGQVEHGAALAHAKQVLDSLQQEIAVVDGYLKQIQTQIVGLDSLRSALSTLESVPGKLDGFQSEVSGLTQAVRRMDKDLVSGFENFTGGFNRVDSSVIGGFKDLSVAMTQSEGAVRAEIDSFAEEIVSDYDRIAHAVANVANNVAQLQGSLKDVTRQVTALQNRVTKSQYGKRGS